MKVVTPENVCKCIGPEQSGLLGIVHGYFYVIVREMGFNNNYSSTKLTISEGISSVVLRFFFSIIPNFLSQSLKE